MVVVETTRSQPGRRRVNSRRIGLSSSTSPTLTAWNQTQGRSPIRNGARPKNFSVPPVPVLARAKRPVNQPRRPNREQHEIHRIEHQGHRGILSQADATPQVRIRRRMNPRKHCNPRARHEPNRSRATTDRVVFRLGQSDAAEDGFVLESIVSLRFPPTSPIPPGAGRSPTLPVRKYPWTPGSRMQQALNFLPEPQGQGSLRPTFLPRFRTGSGFFSPVFWLAAIAASWDCWICRLGAAATASSDGAA